MPRGKNPAMVNEYSQVFSETKKNELLKTFVIQSRQNITISNNVGKRFQRPLESKIQASAEEEGNIGYRTKTSSGTKNHRTIFVSLMIKCKDLKAIKRFVFIGF